MGQDEDMTKESMDGECECCIACFVFVSFFLQIMLDINENEFK